MKGVSWNGLQILITQIYRLIIGIILARLLKPEVFGLIAMVVVFTGFADSLKNLGFQSAIIQKKDITERHLSSAFWLNLLVGISLFIFFLLLADYIASFYNEPILKIIVSVYSFIFIVSSLSAVPGAILQKKLAFKELAIASIISTLLSGFIAVLFAYYEFGVWALVIQVFVASILSICFYFYYSGWFPKLFFDKKSLKELLNFGLNVTGISFLYYWAKEIDTLLIGKILGSGPLGIYNKAYAFLMFPVEKIKYQIINVVFPVFSKIQDDLVRIKKGTLLLISILGFVLFPIMFGVFLISEEFVLLLLGIEWEAMIPIMKIFCIAALFESVKVGGTIMMSIGKPKQLLRIIFFTKLATILLILCGFKWKLTGVSIGICLSIIINFFVETYFAGRYIQLSLLEVLYAIFPPLFFSLNMFLCVYLIDFFYLCEFDLLTRFITKVTLGTSIFSLQLSTYKPNSVTYILSTLKTRKR